MHCVSGSETWGRAGSSSREGIAVADPGNRPDPWRQCGSSHPSPPTLCPRRSHITPTTPLHTERPFANTSWIARLRSSKLRHRDAAGQQPGGDGHRLEPGRGADGGQREPARAYGSAHAGGGAAAHARARAVRGGPEPHRRHRPVPQRPVPPRPGDRARRDERELREPRQLPGLERAVPRLDGSDPRLLDRAKVRRPQQALRGVGVLRPGLHPGPGGGRGPGLRGGDARDPRRRRPRGLRAVRPGVAGAAGRPSAGGRPCQRTRHCRRSDRARPPRLHRARSSGCGGGPRLPGRSQGALGGHPPQ